MATASPIISKCGFCPATEGLLHCQGYKVMPYCSKDHQTAHWPSHRAARKVVSKSQKKLDKEEHDLRNLTNDWMTPTPVFTKGRGHFWGIMATRDYMRARYGLLEAQRKIGT